MDIAEALRAIIALPLVLFLPGYVWSRVFFGRGEIDSMERVALSFGLSIAIVPLSIFFLNKAGMSITAVNSFLTILGLILVALVLERVRRK